MTPTITRSPAGIALVFGVAVVLLAASTGLNAAWKQSLAAPVTLSVSSAA